MKNPAIKYLIGIFLFMMIIGGVKGVNKVKTDHDKQQEYMVNVVKKHRYMVEGEVRDDDVYHKIHSVEIYYSKIEHNPMGGIDIYGYVNNNKSLNFSTGLVDYGNGIEIGSGGTSKKLMDFLNEKP